MKMMKRGTVLFVGLSVLAVTACSAEEPPPAGDAPVMEDTSVEVQDEGNAYNGWSQAPYSVWQLFCGNWVVGSQLVRSAGDATRGGGSCHVRRTTTSCSNDSTCIGLAQSTHGGSAYGYCYQGTCYTRPGGQSSYCALNPNRAAGYIWVHPPGGLYDTGVAPSGWPDAENFVLGCMTKTGGPNTSCGGSNTSAYMRYVVPMEIDTYNCITW
jgi:hypothetical protein